MFTGWKKTTSSSGVLETEDELMRNAEIKRRLIGEVSLAVKQLQRKHIGADLDVERNDEHAIFICTLLEAILLHGYQEHGVKLSNFYNLLGKISTGMMPTNSFWPLVLNFTHKDVLNELEHLSQIHTNVGRCRAWIRLALNDGVMKSYLDALVADRNRLLQFYKPSSFMLDSELPSIMQTFLQGLGEFKFDFNYNTPGLNTWTGDTLALCGIWQLPKVAPQSLARPMYTGIHSHGPSAIPVTIPAPSEVGPQRPRALSNSSVAHKASGSSQSSETDIAELACRSIEDSGEFKRMMQQPVLATTREELENLPLPDVQDGGLECHTGAEEISGVKHNAAMEPSSQDKRHSLSRAVPLMGSNKLGMTSGWSSTFETEAAGTVNRSNEEPQDVGTLSGSLEDPAPSSPGRIVSFGALLKNYTVQGPNRFETPVYEGESNHAQLQQIPLDEDKPLTDSALMVSGFEVLTVSSSVHSELADERATEMLSVVTEITNEKGLDSQNYQCKGCGRNIGMIYGEFKVCSYDACYYCFECHENQEHIIPARVLHNWDLRKYQVAKHCKLFLLQIEEEPLFNIDETNPTLYNIIKELHEVKVLRTQLQHLKGFIFTCKHSIAEDVRRRIWPREYLWDDIHQYSLLDLIQVHSGQLAHLLRKIITHCTKHVYKCKLCCQKGFFCEICNNPKIIYPFEVNTTSQCGKCKAVYHKACISDLKCPKCIRRRKQKAAKHITETLLEFDSPW